MYDISKHRKKNICPINIQISRPYHTINSISKISPSLPPVTEVWQSPKKSYPETPKPYLGSKKSYDHKKTYWGSKKTYNNKKKYWGSKRVIFKPYRGSKKMIHRKQYWGSKRNFGGSKYKNMYKPYNSKKRVGYRRTNNEKDRNEKWNKKHYDEKSTVVPPIIKMVKNRKKN
uniref:Uncharacterized protein n=1 Tax=viral metagenome TaxID=1070528 RepID=A0A6C0C915_9ZZZZ